MIFVNHVSKKHESLREREEKKKKKGGKGRGLQWMMGLGFL
jgi:hypothetical protein